MSSSYNHTFTPPINIEGDEVATLEVRMPTVRDYLDANRATANDEEREVYLLGITTGKGAAWISKMPLPDFLALAEGASDFFSMRGRRRQATHKK